MIKKNRKFLAMGLIALSSVYAIQGVGVELYNNFSNSIHDMKMVSLYNKIWLDIDSKDVNKEIKAYKELANESPINYKFGVFPQKIRASFYNKDLPTAQNVEESAKILNKKVKLL